MVNIRDYQICAKCVMDTSDSRIEFDENGVCDHCLDFDIKDGGRFAIQVKNLFRSGCAFNSSMELYFLARSASLIYE